MLGKVCGDILDNKCLWCINKALEIATSVQRAILDTNYDLKDASCSIAPSLRDPLCGNHKI